MPNRLRNRTQLVTDVASSCETGSTSPREPSCGPHWKTRKEFLLAIEQKHIDITFSIPLEAVSHSQRPKGVGTGVRLRLQGWLTKGEQRK